MKLSQAYRQAKETGKDDVARFMRDMKRAGVKMRFYRGRNFWQGPAAFVDSISEAQTNTRIAIQWDNMGLGYVVYPRQSL